MNRLTHRVIDKYKGEDVLVYIHLYTKSGEINVYGEDEIFNVVDKLAHYEDLEEQGYEMVNINNIITKLESHFMAEENILNMGGYLDAIKIVKDEVENGKTD